MEKCGGGVSVPRSRAVTVSRRYFGRGASAERPAKTNEAKNGPPREGSGPAVSPQSSLTKGATLHKRNGQPGATLQGAAGGFVRAA